MQHGAPGQMGWFPKAAGALLLLAVGLVATAIGGLLLLFALLWSAWCGGEDACHSNYRPPIWAYAIFALVPLVWSMFSLVVWFRRTQVTWLAGSTLFMAGVAASAVSVWYGVTSSGAEVGRMALPLTTSIAVVVAGQALMWVPRQSGRV